MDTVVYYLDVKTREIYRTVNGKREHCCTIQQNASLPAMEKVRKIHQEMHDESTGQAHK